MAGLFNEAFRVSSKLGDETYAYYSLKKLGKKFENLETCPIILKILAENLLRRNREKDLTVLLNGQKKSSQVREISFLPSRVLMQDMTGVPALVDLASMREALKEKGIDPQNMNPFLPIDLVIDHSVMVDRFGSQRSFSENSRFEFQRNKERYAFLKWGQQAFKNLRVVPPGKGICHQINLEHLASVISTVPQEGTDVSLAFPDTLVGTDSHTTMINGLSVLGWGVGGIEAEAALLGQPLSMVVPEVVGFELKGSLEKEATATDLVLTITSILRNYGVVGKFVEFYGEGLKELNLEDRATIANMAPEYGATCGFFPIDEETLRYMKLTGREEKLIALTEGYAKEQGLWRYEREKEIAYDEVLSLDMKHVEPSVSGPNRPQDRIILRKVKTTFTHYLQKKIEKTNALPLEKKINVSGHGFYLKQGSVVIAAITSCTNTSNPSVMMAAGLLARKAVEKGLKVKPWVKTSLAPGSQVVTAYLEKAGLQESLDKLGFNLVGYGCTTCIGNSGPLSDSIIDAIRDGDLTVCSVLSGNRNFEGRVNVHTKASFLASPPLVVAYAIAGRMTIDFNEEPLGHDTNGQVVYLRDIWPSVEEIKSVVASSIDSAMFSQGYKNIFLGEDDWQAIDVPKGAIYNWNPRSTYIKKAPFFENNIKDYDTVRGSRALLILGDSITTDHISPAGSIKRNSPAGLYLLEKGIQPDNFNSYGSRRGNHEVMVRGTFSNIRLQNELTPQLLGGITRHFPSQDIMTVYDAALRYAHEGTPLLIVAGCEYGAGSSRDWAAKGTKLLGVRIVIAESFERIHRANLVGMGVLPLQFPEGVNRKTLALTGEETWYFEHIKRSTQQPQGTVTAIIIGQDGSEKRIFLKARIDTQEEINYFREGSILDYVKNKFF